MKTLPTEQPLRVQGTSQPTSRPLHSPPGITCQSLCPALTHLPPSHPEPALPITVPPPTVARPISR